ncbi:MAG: DedA family protein [Candidatus Marinimicrobia bacterium]|nr:DedA family protein [Candidatus Neomarinimicrobiota bacterium]MBT3630623.1 DedA family protein [Candidatus Neomarinimicrobiota bacterium]MBT3825517.1 DedA family protein [Candidatus Neomarinimicrobiota bacterium]MBT4131835.1 DedA family protein [Candidatus Neomarinimicrobiota bacterium]MBT4295599.1 DedA family protein [Candidatus Neomarinimicrobiota bacterium]
MLESLLSFIEQSPAWLIFLAVFLASYVENIFPPIPGDTILLFGAYLVGRGDLSFSMAMGTTLLGSVLGFLTLYVVGYRYGRRFMYSTQQTWFSPSSLKRVEGLFEKWGYGVVLINRFLAGLRSVVGLFSGIGKLNIWKIIILSTISSLLWNGTLIWLGSTIGENWEQIGVYLNRYNTTVSILIVTIIASFLIHRYLIVKDNLAEEKRSS